MKKAVFVSYLPQWVTDVEQRPAIKYLVCLSLYRKFAFHLKLGKYCISHKIV